MMSAAGPSLLTGVAVLGDSYSDEYQFYSPDRSTAKNYVEQLAEFRGLNFGSFSTASRGVPRNQGYAYDWAQSSDTTADLIANGQHTGAAGQVKAGKVTLAFVFTGGNDVRNVFSSADPVATLTALVPAALTNLNTAVGTLLASNPKLKVVIATAADIGLLPEARGAVAAGILPQALLDAVSGAVDAFNGQLRALVKSNDRLALADVGGLLDNVFARDHLEIGGVAIDRDVPSDEPTHLFLADGLHAGTVGQALLANKFIKAIDRSFGAGVKLFRPEEILDHAGIAHSGKKVDEGNAPLSIRWTTQTIPEEQDETSVLLGTHQLSLINTGKVFA